MGENGRPLELDGRGARFGEREQAGMIFVDGMEVGDIEDVALRDRRMLSADGIFIVVATVSEQDGRSVVPPEIMFRGVPFIDESDGFVADLRDAVDASLGRSAKEQITEIDLLQDHLHDDVAEFVYNAAAPPADDPAGGRGGLGRRRRAAAHRGVALEPARPAARAVGDQRHHAAEGGGCSGRDDGRGLDRPRSGGGHRGHGLSAGSEDPEGRLLAVRARRRPRWTARVPRLAGRPCPPGRPR